MLEAFDEQTERKQDEGHAYEHESVTSNHGAKQTGFAKPTEDGESDRNPKRDRLRRCKFHFAFSFDVIGFPHPFLATLIIVICFIIAS